MSLFPIFKVNIVTGKGKTDKILVFYGNTLEDKIKIADINVLFQKSPIDDKFKNIFNAQEIAIIREQSISVVFVEQSIHIDDNIGVVKLKIFEAMQREVSMDELYLFCLKQERLNPITVYQNLTQNDRLPLTRIRLNQILLNIYDVEGEPIDFGLPIKEKYNFDDILQFDLLKREYLVANVLGQKFVFNSEYPFVANPFLVSEYDVLLEHSRREMSSLNNNLLLETGDFFRNTIFVCLAQNVFEIPDISTDYTAKIYYPFLYKEEITTIEKLDEKRNTLIETTSQKISERNNKNVDLFYDIFRYKKETTKFSEKKDNTGVTYIKITMYPDFKIKIPIDVIFKLLHATKESPLIKFNPETRQENIYRLYTEQISVNGRKIPYLNKANILKLVRTIGKNKSVAVYTNITYKGVNYNMVCEFADDGSMTIYPLDEHFSAPILSIDDIDRIIDLSINPLIQQIKPFFEQSGLELSMFNSIHSTNVEIRELDYQTVYSIKTPINISKYIGCVSSIFTVETDDLNKPKKMATMRLKRVSNFNKKDSQEAFVIEKISQGFKFDEIVEALTNNYEGIDETAASELIAKIRNELELIRGANRRRDLMIKINPGFKTTVELDSIRSEIKITVSNINDINYLNTIQVYIDSFLRITQDLNSTDVPASRIKQLCSAGEIEDIIFEDIVAQSEKDIGENSVPVFENEFAVYPEPEKKKAYNELEVGENMGDLFDILGFEEEDMETITNKGGQGSYSDLSSLSEAELSESSDSGSSLSPPPKKPAITQTVTKVVVPESSESSLSEAELSESSDLSPLNEPEVLVPLPQKPEVTKVVVPESSESSLSEAELSESSDSEPMPPPKKPEVLVPLPQKPEVLVPLPQKPEVLVPPAPINANKREKKIQNIGEEIENKVRDITGMKLKYPNPFSDRLEKRAPQLFVKEKNDKIDVYTRMCPFSLSDRRQPVILTQKEKEEMVAEHPDEINEDADFIEYSTDAKDSSKKFYYTCPRYWCLLTDKMVTEKEILDGKCGPKVNKVEDAIIPNKADSVPKDRYVYQFYDDKENKYPGFHKKQTPSGLCIPCCYNKWTTKEMKNRRDICQGKSTGDNKIDNADSSLNEPEKELKRDVQEIENYVKGPEKYGPQLGEHRWGFLPIAVQKFLHEVNEDCQISKTNTNLKSNHMCLLRHGVETNSQQSFIACIASAMFYGQFQKSKKPLIQKYIPNAKNDVPSIKEMKEIIINALNIDNFIKYQNGNLVTSFANPELKVDIDKPEYRKSQLYKKIHKDKHSDKRSIEDEDEDEDTRNEYEIQMDFFTKVVTSYENFLLFLRDKTIQIDYTYLWDIICMPNPNLFETGLNLIILEIPEDDITNNIEIVCPSNHYSLNPYNAKKRSLFLVKRETYFEPIYGYLTDDTTNRLLVTKTFSEYDRQLSKSLKSVFEKIIKPTLGQKCRPLLSRPQNEYRFKQPPLLDELISKLIHKKYTIVEQILNFQGKVIGLLVKNKKGLEGFVPCFPSALTLLKNKKSVDAPAVATETEYSFSYVSDDIWKSYEDTFKFLKEYYDYDENLSSEEIEKSDCSDEKRFCRIVKDEQVIGFLTNTNQFIRVFEPVPISSVRDNIKTITSNDMMVADMETLTTTKKDSKRIDYIKRIQLETNFYNVFRNTIRILFNDFSNSDKRKMIQDECSQRYILYKYQLNKVVEMLKDLVENTILFTTKAKGFNYTTINENNIHTCVTSIKDKCDESSGICRMTRVDVSGNAKCSLILPKNNLITGSDNEKYYYERMADELIRYNRIKSFIFKPQAYLSFGQIKYNLRDNEIIILQDLLNSDFFKDLEPAEINRYANNQTFDTAAPIITKTYNNDFYDEVKQYKKIQYENEYENENDIVNENANKYDANERNCRPGNPEKISSAIWKKVFPAKYNEVLYGGSNQCTFYLVIDLLEMITGEKHTIKELKQTLFREYSRLCENFQNKSKVEKLINILKEESQVDAIQLEEGGLFNFKTMIDQPDFYMVNFDIWILLEKYEIPSIFISSKEIPETRFNKNAFVSFTKMEMKETEETEETEETNKYVFIVTPALYKRDKLKPPEYKMITNELNKGDIRLDSLIDKTLINEAVANYYTVGEYIDNIYEKDITTKYKPRKKGARNIEFVFEEEEKKEEMDNRIPEIKENADKKIVRIKKVKKMAPTIFLEEDIDDLEEEKEKEKEKEKEIEPIDINDIINNQPIPEPTEYVKPKKTRNKKVSVNPHGKTKKKQPIFTPNIEFNVLDEINK